MWVTPLDTVLFSCIPLACLCTEGSGALAEAVNQGQLLRGGDTQDDDGGTGGGGAVKEVGKNLAVLGNCICR